jgi:hypothetical protein
MKGLGVAGISVLLLAGWAPCAAGVECGAAKLQASMMAAPGVLSLADLLLPGACPAMYQAAAEVSLGVSPRTGGMRALNGGEIRGLVEDLNRRMSAAGKTNPPERRERLPERIVVRTAGTGKSCAEIEAFLGAAHRSPEWKAAAKQPGALACPAAVGVPADATLELGKSAWNPALKRWEFSLRCQRAEDCVPFLVWTRGGAQGAVASGTARPPKAAERDGDAFTLVKRGETAMLTWDEGGIRVVLPVICLEAGVAGQFVSVRLRNATRVLRAEVVGAAAVRVSL